MAAVAICNAGIFDQLSPLYPSLDVWVDEPQMQSDMLAGVASAVQSTFATNAPLEMLLQSQQLLIENHTNVETNLRDENLRLKRELDMRDRAIAVLNAQLRMANANREQAARDLANASTDANIQKSEFVRMRSEMGEMHSELQRVRAESESAQIYAQQTRKESIALRRSLAVSAQSASQQIEILLDRNARLERELANLRSTLDLDLEREIRKYAERRVAYDDFQPAPPLKRRASDEPIPSVRSAPGAIHH